MGNTLNIFVSWSGARSYALASALVEWLPIINPSWVPWMSGTNLQKGERWNRTLEEKLSKCHVGIICVTPENTESPWMIFEAGALSKSVNHSRVCPVLYSMLPAQVEGPLSQFQATVLAKGDMKQLVRTLNQRLVAGGLDEDELMANFEQSWPLLEQKAESISKIAIEGANLPAVLAALENHGLPEPTVGRLVCFNEGFESHWLYQVAAKIAKQRLYVFGRKNRKLFDKQHSDFFRNLRARQGEGFDFRCLFLDPKAPGHILSAAHEDADLPDQLSFCLKQSQAMLNKFGLDPDSVCRVYSIYRATAMVVVDNAVLFAPIDFDPAGKAQALTNHSFQIVDVNLALGASLMSYFLKTWETSAPISHLEQIAR